MNEYMYDLNDNLIIENREISNNKLLVIDNFLKNPEHLKKQALINTYSLYPEHKEKKGYPGIRAAAPKDYSYNLTIFLEPIIKTEFEIPSHLDIRKSVCAFSLMTTEPQDLGPLQSTPHFDASTPYHIAVLLYLCNEEHGGTAFYRHNATGLDRITADNRENYLDIYYEELNAKRPSPGYFGDSNGFFTKTGMIEAKFNRLVLYRGSMLHAPFIDPSISIDPNPATGRLTVNTFYDF
jgi:hypothetical protein